MTRTFNEDEAWENITHVTRANAANHDDEWTLYGVACINPDFTSHGVVTAPNAAMAMEAAKGANATADAMGERHPCRYYPVAISLDSRVLLALVQQLGREET